MTGHDGERHEHKAGDRVGLGRVVKDHEDAGPQGEPDEVEEASNESFPASDPPAFARRAAPREEPPPDPEPPEPRDVP